MTNDRRPTTQQYKANGLRRPVSKYFSKNFVLRKAATPDNIIPTTTIINIEVDSPKSRGTSKRAAAPMSGVPSKQVSWCVSLLTLYHLKTMFMLIHH